LATEGFQTLLSAALSDVLQGREYAVASAWVRTFMGVGLLVAPVIGAKLLQRNIRLPFGECMSMTCIIW
jgi:hypothetical protein